MNANEEYDNEPPDPLEMYIRQVKEFNKAIEEERDPLASGDDGLQVAMLTAAMVESAQTGRLISL